MDKIEGKIEEGWNKRGGEGRLRGEQAYFCQTKRSQFSHNYLVNIVGQIWVYTQALGYSDMPIYIYIYTMGRSRYGMILVGTFTACMLR